MKFSKPIVVNNSIRPYISVYVANKMAVSKYEVSRFEERVADPNNRWYFSKEEILQSPSRIHGVEYEKELSYRQQTSTLIQDMAHRLNLTRVCMATAMAYMHRFFIIHSFREVNRWLIASASLFLAAKVEEQPQKLEYVARVFHSLMNPSDHVDTSSEKFSKLVEDITAHELMVLQTLGFDLQIEHPHAHVVQCAQAVRGISKDLCQAAYIMAHNSLLLTTFCLEHRPRVVATVCLNVACVWKGIELPSSQEDKKWWEYIEPSINQDLLHALTTEFLDICSKCPPKLQKKVSEQIKNIHKDDLQQKHHHQHQHQQKQSHQHKPSSQQSQSSQQSHKHSQQPQAQQQPPSLPPQLHKQSQQPQPQQQHKQQAQQHKQPPQPQLQQHRQQQQQQQHQSAQKLQLHQHKLQPQHKQPQPHQHQQYKPQHKPPQHQMQKQQHKPPPPQQQHKNQSYNYAV